MGAAVPVRRFYDAMGGLDARGLLAVLADHFVVHVSAGLPGFGGTYEGAATALRDCWIPVYERFGVVPRPHELLEVGPDRVVAVGDYEGTVPSTGRRLTAAFAHVFRVVDGRITELRQITDTCRWAAALSQVEVARAVFDAVRARDLDALLGLYADDIVIRDDPALPYGGEHRGREGALAHSMGFAGTWDRYQSDDDRDPGEVLVDDGDRVVARWRLRATWGDRRLDQPTVSVLAVADGRVTSLEMLHADTRDLLAFLGDAGGAASTP